MQAMLQLSRAIDAATAFIGRWASWLILGAIFVSAGNAVVGKLFNFDSNAWLNCLSPIPTAFRFLVRRRLTRSFGAIATASTASTVGQFASPTSFPSISAISA